MAFSSTNPQTGGSTPIPSENLTSLWTWAALAVALLTLGGSLFLSLGMELEACPLCFYQRTFSMALVGVLAMGLVTGAGRFVRLSSLVLPLAVAAWAVAMFHVKLEWDDKLECPKGILGIGTAPQQSLAMFTLISALLLIDLFQARARAVTIQLALVGILFGGLLGFAATKGNPPLPGPPPEEYKEPPVKCRPPYRG